MKISKLISVLTFYERQYGDQEAIIRQGKRILNNEEITIQDMSII